MVVSWAIQLMRLFPLRQRNGALDAELASDLLWHADHGVPVALRQDDLGDGGALSRQYLVLEPPTGRTAGLDLGLEARQAASPVASPLTYAS